MQFLVKIVKDCKSRGPNKISKMELFAEKVNGFQPFIIFVKSAILDVLNTFWILNTVLNTSLEALTTFARSFILDVWLGFRRLWHQVVFSFGRNSESNYTGWRLSRDVLEKSCFGNLILSQIHVRNTYRNKDKITAKYLK